MLALNGLQNKYDKYLLFSDGAGPSNMERLIGLNRQQTEAVHFLSYKASF